MTDLRTLAVSSMGPTGLRFGAGALSGWTAATVPLAAVHNYKRVRLDVDNSELPTSGVHNRFPLVG